MVCFHTKNPNLGKLWRALDWRMFYIFYGHLEYFWRFGIRYDHFKHFVSIWYIFPILVSCTMKNLATLVGSPPFIPRNRGVAPRHTFIIQRNDSATLRRCYVATLRRCDAVGRRSSQVFGHRNVSVSRFCSTSVALLRPETQNAETSPLHLFLCACVRLTLFVYVQFEE
jgi:hypothetical protein